MSIKKRLEELCAAGRVAGHELRYLPETGSTNEVALEQGRLGASTGLVIVADHQLAGRGRLDKKWLSSSGDGLYFSMVLRPRLAWEEMARITLAAGLGVAEALASVVSEPVLLKWPNDIIVAGKKCGGILAESDMADPDMPLVVLGVGLNLRRPAAGYPPAIANRAGALAEYCRQPLEQGDVLESLVVHLDRVLEELEDQQWPAVRQRWRQRDITMGRRLTWLTTTGAVVNGVSRGIDDNGLLFIRDDNGTLHQVLSGDVQLQAG